MPESKVKHQATQQPWLRRPETVAVHCRHMQAELYHTTQKTRGDAVGSRWSAGAVMGKEG